MTRATAYSFRQSPGQPVTPLKVIFLADTRPGHYHLAEGVIAAVKRLRPVEVTRIEVKRKWIVPTRWLRRRAAPSTSLSVSDICRSRVDMLAIASA